MKALTLYATTMRRRRHHVYNDLRNWKQMVDRYAWCIAILNLKQFFRAAIENFIFSQKPANLNIVSSNISLKCGTALLGQVTHIKTTWTWWWGGVPWVYVGLLKQCVTTVGWIVFVHFYWVFSIHSHRHTERHKCIQNLELKIPHK